MAIRPRLDWDLTWCCIHPRLLGNWRVINGTWEDFQAGRCEAVRTIRHHGRKYWVTASNNREDGFAVLMARGLLGSGPKMFRMFILHRLDPRTLSPRERHVQNSYANLGSVGVITRIGKVIKEEGWTKRSTRVG